MELDPTRWLVSLAGFIYDWIITREWRRIALSLTPVFLLATVAVLVWWGRHLDRIELAGWYMELGDAQIAEWEQSWAPEATVTPVSLRDPAQPASPQPDKSIPQPTASEAVAPDAAESQDEVSRFAEVLFRRVQLLAPSDRSQFVIAARLAQRGARSQAQSMLTKIAPDDGRGYAPAHALLAQFYLQELQQGLQADGVLDGELAQRLMHHVSEAKRWERVPQSVLQAGSDLHLDFGDKVEALSLLAQSAERNPQDYLKLAQRSKTLNPRLYEQAWPKAEAHLNSQLELDPKDSETRLQLAQLYALNEQLDKAEEVLQEGDRLQSTPEITRGLSEIYRLRYRQSNQTNQQGEFSANIQLLDTAMRLDPSNPGVAEEVARLVRLSGDKVSEELIDRLEAFLAEGKATAATHAWLSEAHLLNNEFEAALPHLEQVVYRLPNAAQYLNNLAYVLADLYPDRLPEAFEYARRAVTVAGETNKPNPDFYDTLGIVLSKMGRGQEAITAFETAIELSPQKIDFHQRVAAEYRKQGNATMAEKHEQRIAELQAQATAAAATTEEATEATEPTETTPAADEKTGATSPTND